MTKWSLSQECKAVSASEKSMREMRCNKGQPPRLAEQMLKRRLTKFNIP